MGVLELIAQGGYDGFFGDVRAAYQILQVIRVFLANNDRS